MAMAVTLIDQPFELGNCTNVAVSAMLIDLEKENCCDGIVAKV